MTNIGLDRGGMTEDQEWIRLFASGHWTTWKLALRHARRQGSTKLVFPRSRSRTPGALSSVHRREPRGALSASTR